MWPRHKGKAVFILGLAVLSVLAGINFRPGVAVYLAGEVADRDVTANQPLLIEDEESTEARKKEVASNQPPVFDLSSKPLQSILGEVNRFLTAVQKAQSAEVDKLSRSLGSDLGIDLDSSTVDAWRNQELRKIYRGKIKSWLRKKYAKGVVADNDLLKRYDSGILVRTLSDGLETLRMDTQKVRDVGEIKQSLRTFLQDGLNLRLRSRKAVQDLLFPLLRPNLVLNQESTQKRLEQVLNQVDPVYYRVAKGEVLVRKGERVSPEQQKKLQALFRNKPDAFSPGISLGIFTLFMAMSGVFFFVSSTWSNKSRTAERDISFVAVVVLVLGSCAKFLSLLSPPLSSSLATINPALFAYSLPVMGGTGLLSLFLRQRTTLLSGIVLVTVCTVLLDMGIDVFIYFLTGSFFYFYLLKYAHTRLQLLKSIFPLAALLVALWLGINLVHWKSWTHLGAGTVFVCAGAFFSLIVILAFSPMVEYVLGYTSVFRLMDLMNLEQPLLQRLMIEAPGSYHHSLVVSNMVEAGARRIGADSLLAKIAALYHDIGKLANPEYFIENQRGGKNKHDKLSPSMSALILISHVKKGVEMGRRYNLGEEIVDLIRQHHGTTLISWFYNKAVEQAGSKGVKQIREEAFRYPGPKPQTKEAGILLLADVIEASSRTLVDPTPSRIKGHIQNTIRKIYTQGELDESELTLKELYVLGEVFLKILLGIFHQRIEYPGEKKKMDSRGESRARDTQKKPAGKPEKTVH